MSLQGGAFNLGGSDFRLKIDAPKPLQPRAGPSNSKASAPGDATAMKYKCKLCPGSNREFMLRGLEDHSKAKHGVTNFRAEDIIRA
ncbi:hypothetical protein M407DRAFT_118454 [Tulasnella calospora MUT 4182]|uniref:Uncharacterized protein n=1 Tax=Tulasnella calospora MUT 4182 TaxID=1051891 RepID=A0A0C3QIP8_9AGAM|nr:hypothetical protein M407DRAFT_118454 [Tulasnella calospora MUT 4182]